MSANPYETLKEKYFELESKVSRLELKLLEMEIPASKKYYTMAEMAEMTGLSKHTIYKRLDFLEHDLNYFYSNGKSGKLLFDEQSVDLLVKGVNQNGKSIHTERQPISLGDFFSR